ncbi:hypothetical protein MC885_005762 [Smutsia gigantea]|nr:hypothetical protein MC885_005762 [Smutsia gigantea]
MIMLGDKEKTFRFLQQFSRLLTSAFLWLPRLHNSICLQWIAQCFWNYLDWMEICHYIATCVFLGPDYQEEALHRFRVSDYFEYMEILEQNYRPVLLRDMRNIRVQST